MWKNTYEINWFTTGADDAKHLPTCSSILFATIPLSIYSAYLKMCVCVYTYIGFDVKYGRILYKSVLVLCIVSVSIKILSIRVIETKKKKIEKPYNPVYSVNNNVRRNELLQKYNFEILFVISRYTRIFFFFKSIRQNV